MKMLFCARLTLVVNLALVLAACGGASSHGDLKRYIDEKKNQPSGEIDPLPPVRTYDAYEYRAAKLRSPFERPVEEVAVQPKIGGDSVKPDPTRPKEFLERYNLESLSMVGTLQQKGQLWALISEPTGGVQRVTVGNYMGKNHGRIERASESAIDLIEIVSDGLGGWVKRPKTLKLSEKE